MKSLVMCLLASASLCAESLPESTSLSSASADYNGNTLILKGHVVLDHGLGKMMSDQAFLEKQEAGKDFPFSFIRLLNQVKVELPGLAELHCDSADLDFVSLKGVLHPKEKDKVTYIDNSKEQVRMMSSVLELEMTKQGFDGKKTTYDLDKIVGKGGIIIDYAKVFTLRADHAFFQKKDGMGAITAFPNENELCHMTHEGDTIDSEIVYFDLANSKLSFKNAKGIILSSIVPQVQKAEISFKSDQLQWDHVKNVLTLKGNVQVKESSLGTITSDNLIQLAQSKQKGKRVLKSIRSQGNTILNYQDPNDKTVHEIISHGSFILDQQQLRISIESPLVEGSVPAEKQISYKEKELTVFSDKALMEYAIVEDTLQPVSITLKGHVKMASHNSNEPSLCAIADRVVFSPETKTLILAADPQKRVLFWDQGQGLRISSQEIHINQDPTTKQRSVKGVGNVKFAFSPEEHNVLHKLFPSYKAANE